MIQIKVEVEVEAGQIQPASELRLTEGTPGLNLDLFFYAGIGSSVMHFLGHVLVQAPQPMQLPGFFTVMNVLHESSPLSSW